MSPRRPTARDIWLVNPDSGGRERLTERPETPLFPAWSPDSRWIVFASGTGTTRRRASGELA